MAANMSPREREWITTLLDVLGLLLISLGVGAALKPVIGWGWALIVSGVLVLAGSQVAQMRDGRK